MWYNSHISRAWISNHIPQYLWDVITYPCPRCLAVTHKSSYNVDSPPFPFDQPQNKQSTVYKNLKTRLTFTGPSPVDGIKCRFLYLEPMRRINSFVLCDDIMIWKHIPHYWPVVMRVCRSPVDSHHKVSVMWSFKVSFVVSLNKLSYKQWNFW